MDLFLAAREHVGGRDVADCRMESFVVVVVDVFLGDPVGIFRREWGLGVDAVVFVAEVEALDLPVGLRVVGRGGDVGVVGGFQEAVELTGGEL